MEPDEPRPPQPPSPPGRGGRRVPPVQVSRQAPVDARLGTSTAARPSGGWVIVGRIKAGMVVFTVLLAMLACVLLQPLLKNLAADQGVEVSGLGALYISYPWLGIVLGIPALAACVPLIRGKGKTMLWMSLATILALLPFGLLFAGFLAVVVPLYTEPVKF